jgi:hypothetical protein
LWPAAIRYVRREEKMPNAEGCISGYFGGGFYSIHYGLRPEQYLLGAGPQWNVDSVKDTLVDCREHFVPPSKEERAVSLEWRALLDADPEGTTAQAIQRVEGQTWRWTEAREDVVARGLPAVPALLDAMKSSGGELRQRFEGCVSRIARDARNGIDRGSLDVKAVERHLSDPKSDLADIAAEAIGASGAGGVKRLIAGLSDAGEASACAWALGYARNAGAGGPLCAVLTGAGFSPAAKVNAARSVGRLKVKEAAGALARLIETVEDPAAQREAAWALALLGARGHDKAVATLLHSPDARTRCRAVMALAVLRSPELLGVGHMLASGNRNEAWIATWALFPGHVFDRFICMNRTWDDGGEEPKPRYQVAKTFHRVHHDILDIAEAVPRDAAVKLIREAAPQQKDELLKALMERIPTEPGEFEYQNRPYPPRK